MVMEFVVIESSVLVRVAQGSHISASMGRDNIVYCHCSQCRKVQGSAFATNGVVKADEFAVVSGEEALRAYQYGPGKVKYFCSACASPMFSRNAALPDVVRIRLGTLEGEVAERPWCHIFVGSKANWYEISDDLPQYDGFPEG